MTVPHDLNRFLHAQEGIYEHALAEIRSGRKQTHWMWFVFPQFHGLGSSSTSVLYSIKSAAEARAYCEHSILGPRLLECAEVVLAVGRSPIDIFGALDAQKLRSSAMLFAAVSPPESVFHRLIDQCFQSQPDETTLRLLAGGHPDAGSV